MPERGWGGARSGAGRKPTWQSGRCRTIKVPEALLADVLRYARQLDAGSAPAAPSPTAAGEREWDLLDRTVADLARARRHLEEQETALGAERKRVAELERQLAARQGQGMAAYKLLSDALVEHRRDKSRGIRVTPVEQAIHALSGYQEFPRHGAPPERQNDGRWEQVSKLIDEKQALARALKQRGDDVAEERRKAEGARAEAATLQSRIREAASILRAAIGEHEKGARRGISVRDARSALGNLTGWKEELE